MLPPAGGTVKMGHIGSFLKKAVDKQLHDQPMITLQFSFFFPALQRKKELPRSSYLPTDKILELQTNSFLGMPMALFF